MRDIKIDEALLVLCLAYYVMKFYIAEIEMLWLSRNEIWGTRITSIFFVFSVMAGWIAEMLLCYFLPILLCNRQNLAEYEAYWLMGFQIINLWGELFTSIFSVCILCYGWMDCRDTFHAVLCLYCCLTNAKKAKYEVNWLISGLITNS